VTRVKVQVIPVTEGVWCFRRPSYFACSYLVCADVGVFAVDVGMNSDAEDFAQGLNELGIAPNRLKAIFLTHWHNDHSAGAASLKRRFGVRVYYPEVTSFLLRDKPLREASEVGLANTFQRKGFWSCYAGFWKRPLPRQ
jgi:glyoxylase-like metal-dependent hydrolase (beta-lactamase superfamily II)